MREMRITFTDKEFNRLKALKKQMSNGNGYCWRKFILTLIVTKTNNRIIRR